MAENEFVGKVALVTGAGGGIGRSIAIEWSRRGGTAIVTDIDEALARAAVDDIRRAGGEAHAFRLDVTSLAEIRTVVAAASAAGGGLDALFNVAGINIPKNVVEMEDDEWQRVMDTNLASVYRCSKYALPELRKRGGGAIVNIASIAGIMGENRCSAYTASKGGVVLLTRNMAMDFADYGVRVNAICPGSTKSPRIESYWRKAPGGRRDPTHPLKRYAEPEEIARPAVFLASSDASYITGAILVVDGGMTAGFRIPILDEM